ncbi:MAG: VanZ family protein [Dehalococcoidia bacterium]
MPRERLMTAGRLWRNRSLLLVAAGGSLLLILVATLTTDASHRGTHWLRDHEWGPIGLGVSAARAAGIGRSDVEVAVHLFIFALFGALVLAALRSLHWRRPSAGVVAVTLAAVLGAATEVAQLLVADRTASPLDWSVDVIGALLGILLLEPARWSVRVLTRRRSG